MPELTGVSRLVQLDGVEFDAGKGVTLHGLSGRVRLQASAVDGSPRWIGIRDSEDLKELDLSELKPGFWLDLGVACDELRVQLPVGGASLSFSFSIDLPRLTVVGHVEDCLVHCLSGEDWHQTPGVYFLGPSNGLRFFRGVNFRPGAEAEVYIRLDQSGRGLQAKAPRGRVTVDEVCWTLLEPSRVDRDPLGCLFRAALSTAEPADFSQNVNELACTEQERSIHTLGRRLAGPDRNSLCIDPLKVLCLHAWAGADRRTLWKIRCALREASIDFHDKADVSDTPREAILFWPPQDKRRFSRKCLRYWDMQLFLLCRPSMTESWNLETLLEPADELGDAAVLAMLLDQIGLDHPSGQSLASALARATGAIEAQLYQRTGGQDRRKMLIWCRLAEQEPEAGLWRQETTTLDLLLDMAPLLDRAGCLDSLCQLIEKFAGAEQRILHGMSLMKRGCRQGRPMIASALRTANRISAKRRAQAMEYLLSPVGCND